MNKNKILLLLPLLLSIVSCGPTNEEDNEKYSSSAAILNLLNNVNVQITGTETTKFEEGYSYLDKINSYNINRDYSKIKEKDGSYTPAVRDNNDVSFRTYFRAKDGGTSYELLNPDNTVQEVEYKINYNKVLFNEYFINPFEYVDVSDIDEEGNLDLTKANIIFEAYTGLSAAPSSAKLNIENGYATSLDLTLNDRIDIIDTGVKSIVGTASFDFEINFSYDVAPLTHLSPRSGADEKITKALTNKNNYTLTFETDLVSNKATIYITEDAIFYQNSINTIGAADGDIYYKKVAENTYESYVYKASVGKFNIEELSLNISAILPDFSKINPNILLKESDSVYLIDKIAAVNCLDDFVIPSYFIGDGLGLNGTLIVDENNNVSQYRGRYNASSPFNIIQNYTNYGSTSIPSWLDVTSIK